MGWVTGGMGSQRGPGKSALPSASFRYIAMVSLKQGDSGDYFCLIKISFGGHEGQHSLRLMYFVLQTMAKKKKKEANNLAFRLAALVQRLAHHSVVSGCYRADPWICVYEGWQRRPSGPET